jgi:competence protein ComFC
VDKIIKTTVDFLQELFFPSFCLGCQKEGTLLCSDCVSTLDISEHHYCLCNKNPLRLPPESKKGTCSRCQHKKLAGLYFALSYKEKILTRKLIYQFKYEPYVKNLAQHLAGILREHLVMTGKNTLQIAKNSLLVPVPMEIKKMKNRGYNQSYELAKELSLVLHLPVIANSLVKIKKTLPQMQLTAKERQENLANAFAVKNPAEIKGKKIFLVDDVYTTGSTMEECAKVLCTSGAKQVWGIAIAREE